MVNDIAYERLSKFENLANILKLQKKLQRIDNARL